eukprot:152845-Prorocentrum_minimum.AAC.1
MLLSRAPHRLRPFVKHRRRGAQRQFAPHAVRPPQPRPLRVCHLHKGHPPVHAAVKSAPHKHPPHLGGGSSCVRGGWYNQAKTPK